MPAVFLIFFVITPAYAEEHYKKFGNGNVVFVKQNMSIDVEVATTKMQRTIGLMFRQS